MEYAIFISKQESLDKYRDIKMPENLIPLTWRNGDDFSFHRLYFGQEFCERLISTQSGLQKALEFAEKRLLKFSFLTPYVSEEWLKKWENLLETLYSLKPESEVVINDLGIFHLIRERFPKFTRVLGRLLTKQKRGPRILRMEGKVPDQMIEHFRRFNADVPHLAKFYKELGFNRIELDNTLQGIRRDSDTIASLYFPYIYVSTTRMCLTNQSDNRQESMRAIFPCKKECMEIHFTIEHNEIPVPVTIAGNTQFIRSEKLPPSPEGLQIDRLVYEPEIPI